MILDERHDFGMCRIDTGYAISVCSTLGAKEHRAKVTIASSPVLTFDASGARGLAKLLLAAANDCERLEKARERLSKV
jgi:hypothetical protein